MNANVDSDTTLSELDSYVDDSQRDDDDSASQHDGAHQGTEEDDGFPTPPAILKGRVRRHR
ncbi:hypothetical protein PsorP6_017661 [Peronosclerospora sorghi]|uniref:Uncharacterized protein n=1 Tax=Peronosclerospora sorghi TaxID=230839 RepID=A0ACC0WN44_9STRA|nr:hypothetical protein PsorP6_017661 [Peronosclerospora sorghi]